MSRVIYQFHFLFSKSHGLSNRIHEGLTVDGYHWWQVFYFGITPSQIFTLDRNERFMMINKNH